MSDQEFSDTEIDVGSICSPSNSAGGSVINDLKRQARAQHNALERRRRDNIKDMYTSLKEEIPNFSNDRASRAQILKKTIEQIQELNDDVSALSGDLKKIEETNRQLREQIAQKALSQQTQANYSMTNYNTS